MNLSARRYLHGLSFRFACSPLRTHLPRKKRLALFTPELYAAPPLFVNKLAQTNSTQFYIPHSDTKNAPPISPFASPPSAVQKPPQTSRLLLIFNIVAATFARLFQCSRDSTIRSFYARACAHGTVPVEHAERAPPMGTRKNALRRRAPPMGTRKNALRRWRCSIFFLMPALVQARRVTGRLHGGARKACAPVRHSQKRLAPMALLGLFSYACARASTARGWDVCPVEHAERAPPMGTRKNALRRWRCGACAPYGHSQKRLAPMALLGLFSYACARASTARA